MDCVAEDRAGSRSRRRGERRIAAGDIVCLAGIEDITIGETIADLEHRKAIPPVAVDEPTVSMIFGVNTSPMAGRDARGCRVRCADAAHEFRRGMGGGDKIFYTTGRLTSEMVIKAAQMQIPFLVSRVVLQDFTGVPLLADLAAMRNVAEAMGKNPKTIEPLVPVDLVVDHSVQIDHYGNKNALDLNMKLEFKRNEERYQFMKWGMQAFDTFKVVPPGIGIVHQVNLEYLAKGVLSCPATINDQPSTHFVCYDGNGNVMALVSAADGSPVGQYEYGPFGELLRATGPMAKEGIWPRKPVMPSSAAEFVSRYTSQPMAMLGAFGISSDASFR